MEYHDRVARRRALDGGAMTVDQESAQLGYGPAKHDPQGLLMSQLARDTLAIVLAGGRRGGGAGAAVSDRGPPGAKTPPCHSAANFVSSIFRSPTASTRACAASAS